MEDKIRRRKVGGGEHESAEYCLRSQHPQKQPLEGAAEIEREKKERKKNIPGQEAAGEKSGEKEKRKEEKRRMREQNKGEKEKREKQEKMGNAYEV